MIHLKDLLTEDLRAWFGKGGKGGVGGGGWDRYNSSGDRVGKCGDAKEGDPYSACLSKEKAKKLGKAGRAAFVKRKRAAQKKGGDAKKGGEQSKGQKPIKVKTGINEIGEASLKPYKYKIEFEDGEEIQYEFTTNSKLKYNISIAQKVPNVRKKEIRLVVAFKPEGKTYDTITNKGEQFKIMATVVAAVKEYLAKVPDATEISFTPSKADEGDMRRANLYKAYIAKQLPGSKIEIFSDGRYIVELPKKIKNEIILKEYTPSNPADIDKAIREIEKLGVRNPINPKEIVIDDSVIIEVSNWDKRLWFSSLYSIDRGQGNASKIMKKIMDIADKYKVTVALDPHPFGTGSNRLNRDQLVKFYKKFGFEFEDGEEDFGDMERIAENFMDGKNPGRKGLSKKVGVSQKMSISQLEKIVKSSSGEKRKMAQWNLNMKRGKQKSIKGKAGINEVQGKTLHIYDFDDTLVKTKANVIVKKEDGSQYELSSHEFATHKLTPGESYDFSNFDKVIHKSVPISRNIKQILQSLQTPNTKTTVLTARRIAFPITKHLKDEYGVNVYVVAVGSSNPEVKADWIENQVDKGYVNVKFMDDSVKNLEAVKTRLSDKDVNLTLINALNNNTETVSENLDPATYKDTGKAAPYGSGYQELEEKINLFLEKNIPTDKSKWSYYKSQAKKKFDVYPSAYANAWAAKMYKKAGGGWRKGK